MFIKLVDISHGGGQRIAIRCPNCGQVGTFEPIPNTTDIHVRPDKWLGQRKCPNPPCSTHIFAIFNNAGTVLRSYPPQRIDFDPKGIPQEIVKSFSEALSCHAEGIHVAAAIMIRRTLEELCQNKGATGSTLKDRIGALQSKVVLPTELFVAIDDLRLLGNDAAHIEAKTYDSIGQEEIEVAIELTKEVLKAVYQLDSLLSRLRALKKP
jgi:Domain of unknown function (DUF4145)